MANSKNTNFKKGSGTLLEEAVREHIIDTDFVHRGSCRDANDAIHVGVYDVSGISTNVPHQFGILITYNRFTNSSNYLWQEMRNSGDLMWTRTKWNGVWTAWKSRG